MEEYRKRIESLRKERNAVILAHNYQPPEIQDLADSTGDSLELSRRAVDTEAEVIVFCGVGFMAETAAILNPDKIVVLPRLEAGCPMADMIAASDVIRIRREHPGIPVVTYVNSSATVKAESTVCCTSANSVRVVESFEDRDAVYMAPDRNLARYTARHTSKTVHFWNGYCPVHEGLSSEDVQACRREHPEALFLAHPECRPEVLDLADAVESTSGMLRFVRESSASSFIVGTESGILHPLRSQSPEKKFIPASPRMICPDMKRIGLEDVCKSLENLEPRVTVPEEVRLRALKAVERMIALK